MFKSNKFLWFLFLVVCIPLACSIYFMREQEKEFNKLGDSIKSIRAGVDQLKREREGVDQTYREMNDLEEQTTEDMKGLK